MVKGINRTSLLRADGDGHIPCDYRLYDKAQDGLSGGCGLIRVFRSACRDGDTEHGATDDLTMDELTRLGLAVRTWAIEERHRGLE